MKLILCGWCNCVKSIPAAGPIYCDCKNMSAWYNGPGSVYVHAIEKEFVRIIGISNSFLKSSYDAENFTNEDWRNLSEMCCSISEGYIFHTDQRNCPIAIMKVGETKDTHWSFGKYEHMSI